jgi:PAS domain S-box-containing protein
VTDREKATADLVAHLRRSEERFRTICENAPVMIDQFDDLGRCLLWNHECEKQLGYTHAELDACDDPLELFYPDEIERGRVRAAIVESDGTFREYRVRAKDGSDRAQIWANFRLPDGAHISVGHDVTEQRQVEEQLRQSQKMEALGQLTGGMAHDFNNLLTIVMANADHLQDMVLPPGAAELVAEIVDAATRGGTLIQKLLAVGRTNALDRRPLDLNRLVRELAPTLGRLLPDSIRIRVETEPSVPAVAADQGAIEQILINLATNARDAMDGTGSLTLSLERRWVDAEEAERHACTAGEHVAITVADTGVGMDESTRERVFEPFFTTKGDKGTGLGMPMVYGLMRQHDGAAWVDSDPDVGTRVHLLFPVHRPSDTPRGRPSSGARRILIVEDEPSIRRITATMLQHRGYATEEAPDGRRALQLLERSAFDLVLTDVVMPGMGGVELFQALQRRGGTIPVLFMTGYAEADVLDRISDRGAVLLRKPFRAEQLIEAVASVLDAAQTPPRPE